MISDPDLDIPRCEELEETVDDTDPRDLIKSTHIVDPDDTQSDTFWGEKYCAMPYEQTCVGYEKICKAYCPGGVIQPISKQFFYSQGYQRTGKISPIDTYTEGYQAGEF